MYNLSLKAKRILLGSVLLLGYIFTLLAISYALAHRGWIGNARECLIHALLGHAKDLGMAARNWQVSLARGGGIWQQLEGQAS